MDYIYLGGVPADESCSDIPDRYTLQMWTLIKQIRRTIGNEPQGTRLTIMGFATGGGYRDVVCRYDEKIEESVEYAYKAEAMFPSNWDLQSLVELTAGLTPIKGDSAWKERY